jgi:hypothetical protein
MLLLIVLIAALVAILGYKAQKKCSFFARIFAGILFSLYTICFVIMFIYGALGNYTLRFTIYSFAMSLLSGTLCFAFLKNKMKLPWRKIS